MTLALLLLNVSEPLFQFDLSAETFGRHIEELTDRFGWRGWFVTTHATQRGWQVRAVVAPRISHYVLLQ